MRGITYWGKIGCLVAVLTMLAGGAHAALWVGAEIGPNFIANTDVTVTTGPAFASNTTLKNARVGPAVLGGLTVGYDFVNAGCLCYEYPSWMSYFGFLVDFSYNRYPVVSQNLTAVNNINGASQTVNFRSADGKIYPLAFVFYAHYGLFPDADVPVGRVHPYIGVGPAIAFSSLEIKGLGSQSAANIALAVEGGLRFILLSNVTLDVSLRYRRVSPEYGFTTANGQKVDVNFTANSFTPLARVAYHF
jgi:opacity protein-like surface antigen